MGEIVDNGGMQFELPLQMDYVSGGGAEKMVPGERFSFEGLHREADHESLQIAREFIVETSE